MEYAIWITLLFIALQLYECARQLVNIHRILIYRLRADHGGMALQDAYKLKDPNDQHD
jgi:hypothetical protein